MPEAVSLPKIDATLKQVRNVTLDEARFIFEAGVWIKKIDDEFYVANEHYLFAAQLHEWWYRKQLRKQKKRLKYS